MQEGSGLLWVYCMHFLTCICKTKIRTGRSPCHNENKMEKVILGMPGDWAEDDHEIADHYTSKIGGLPDWPIPNFDVSPDLLECRECGNKFCLVAQIYAPVSSKTLRIEERVIYIFGCVMASCGSTPLSWRAVRVQKSFSSEGTKSPHHDAASLPASALSDSKNKLKEDVWKFDLEEGDDGSDDDIDLEELGRALSEAATLASHSKKLMHEPETCIKPSSTPCTTRTIDDKVPVLPCFYINTEEEKVAGAVSSVSTKQSSLSVKENESDGDDHSREETWEEEGYEYDRALNADRTYLKFMKRLNVYPEQCFRYSYGGKPLLATGEVKEPGTCSLCGGSTLFELQLMPPLIYFLQEATDDQRRNYIDNWNWITLIVYTCSESCAPSLHQEKSGCESWIVAEETVAIQYE